MPQWSPEFEPLAIKFPTELSEAIRDAPLPGLGDEPNDASLASWLDRHTLDNPRWLAGLWLLAGDLHRSHRISQEDTSAAGSFWHGIMHRREGDFSNAKYWFRRVGDHPVLRQLAQQNPRLHPDPFTFVDHVEQAASQSSDASELIQIQWREWQLLMDHA